MGGWIEYKGNKVAYYNFTKRGNNPKDTEDVLKVNLRFTDIDAMELLFRASSTDIVLVEGEEMSYLKFRKEILEKANRIYPSHDAEMMDNESAREMAKIGLDTFLRNKKTHEKLDELLGSSEFQGDIRLTVEDA